jgi:hypothetical protein
MMARRSVLRFVCQDIVVVYSLARIILKLASGVEDVPAMLLHGGQTRCLLRMV